MFFVSRLSVRRLQVPVVSCHCLVTSTRPLSVEDQHFQVFSSLSCPTTRISSTITLARTQHSPQCATPHVDVLSGSLAETVPQQRSRAQKLRRCRDNAHRSILHRMTTSLTQRTTLRAHWLFPTILSIFFNLLQTAAVIFCAATVVPAFLKSLVFSQARATWCENNVLGSSKFSSFKKLERGDGFCFNC